MQKVTFEWAQETVNGEAFGVVRVFSHVLRDPSLAAVAIAATESMMGVSPVALMVVNPNGSTTYAGPTHLIAHLETSCDPSQFIWQRVTREVDPLHPWPFASQS